MQTNRSFPLVIQKGRQGCVSQFKILKRREAPMAKGGGGTELRSRERVGEGRNSFLLKGALWGRTSCNFKTFFVTYPRIETVAVSFGIGIQFCLAEYGEK